MKTRKSQRAEEQVAGAEVGEEQVGSWSRGG